MENIHDANRILRYRVSQLQNVVAEKEKDILNLKRELEEEQRKKVKTEENLREKDKELKLTLKALQRSIEDSNRSHETWRKEKLEFQGDLQKLNKTVNLLKSVIKEMKPSAKIPGPSKNCAPSTSSSAKATKINIAKMKESSTNPTRQKRAIKKPFRLIEEMELKDKQQATRSLNFSGLSKTSGLSSITRHSVGENKENHLGLKEAAIEPTPVLSSTSTFTSHVYDCNCCGQLVGVRSELEEHKEIVSTVLKNSKIHGGITDCTRIAGQPGPAKSKNTTHGFAKQACDVGSMRYTCFCGKSFRTRRCVINHIRVEVLGKKFKCNVCVKVFSKLVCLKNHLLHVHRLPYLGGSFGCWDCGNVYWSEQERRLHRLNAHPTSI